MSLCKNVGDICILFCMTLFLGNCQVPQQGRCLTAYLPSEACLPVSIALVGRLFEETHLQSIRFLRFALAKTRGSLDLG